MYTNGSTDYVYNTPYHSTNTAVKTKPPVADICDAQTYKEISCQGHLLQPPAPGLYQPDYRDFAVAVMYAIRNAVLSASRVQKPMRMFDCFE